jgi:hypothetical protein
MDKKRFHVTVPYGTKWEGITLRFLDGHTMEIKVKGKNKTEIYDYRQMGFENQKSHIPNKNWEFLQDIAETQGEVTRGIGLRYKNIKERKAELSKALKRVFPTIEDEPFPSL